MESMPHCSLHMLEPDLPLLRPAGHPILDYPSPMVGHPLETLLSEALDLAFIRTIVVGLAALAVRTLGTEGNNAGAPASHSCIVFTRVCLSSLYPLSRTSGARRRPANPIHFPPSQLPHAPLSLGVHAPRWNADLCLCSHFLTSSLSF